MNRKGQWERLERLLDEAIEARNIPGAVAAVGLGEDTLWRTAKGLADATPGQERQMEMDTLFDMASLTKVTATLPSILRLVEDGHLDLRMSIAAFYPQLSGTDREDVTVLHLLTHTSGLVPHREYFRNYASYDEILAVILNEDLTYATGSKVEYSDLGFILLGDVIRRVTGIPLDQFAHRQVFDAIGMTQTRFRPPLPLRSMVAATEPDLEGVPKVGVVHDENAEAMGGVSGHAGLFSSLLDMENYTKSWLVHHDGFLSKVTREASYRLRTAGLNGRRGLGWSLRHDGFDVGGDLWPETAVSHTGFTGTSVLFDPASCLWAILLTNRVHFGRSNNIAQLRRRFHNVAAAIVNP